MIEILLVDDHPHVRQILRELIETYDDLKIIGEATNGEEAVLFAAKLKPAAVVMDIHLPVLNGVAANHTSQILSTSENGHGGTIDITTQALHQDATSVIDASSQFSTNGTVTTNGAVQP